MRRPVRGSSGTFGAHADQPSSTSASPARGVSAVATTARRRTHVNTMIPMQRIAPSSESQIAIRTWRCGVHSNTTSNPPDAGAVINQPFA